MKQEQMHTKGTAYTFNDRDLSWLSFNERVLLEAQRDTVPLMERIRFLAIYSSNLDEFFRVRMPALMVLHNISRAEEHKGLLATVKSIVVEQQNLFGRILRNNILPQLKEGGYHLRYHEPLTAPLLEAAEHYFAHHVAAFLQVVDLSEHPGFFPENNKLYLAVETETRKGRKKHYLVNIPSDCIPRFFTVTLGDGDHIVFLDDVLKQNLAKVIQHETIVSSHSIKVTRDAELDLQDEFTGNLARKIEKKISRRDFGLATRLLYEPGLAGDALDILKHKLGLRGASAIEGGYYHNLKDLASLPVNDKRYSYEPWPQCRYSLPRNQSLLQAMAGKDILLHPPFHSYETMLRFFNEAALDHTITHIYCTLYRVAHDSRIVNALISAAKNGKKVTVFVELKARFDEANNLRWAKKMKGAGVKIIESIPGLKVHAKIALAEARNGKKTALYGVLATGNFNEHTARYYTDHVLLTAEPALLREVKELFQFLRKRTKPGHGEKLSFNHLLVGQFNLQKRFIDLIEREIEHARGGLPASIIIKMNNLEDRVLISKLYDASQAGVVVTLIIRGINCLVPGVKGMSERITVRRIVDRYLEHGRIFVFHNNNAPEVYLGSADWMNRNIYRRIEVCFPVTTALLKQELLDIVHLQLSDNQQAVQTNAAMKNTPLPTDEGHRIRSQQAIAALLFDRQQTTSGR